ncbi:hypothetical protein FOA52_002992 [Chlamydomonas sp. UWO 241]|nr:hypothetical protein FOA52_002992 [Chlamydomonas sp. UWO 241]
MGTLWGRDENVDVNQATLATPATPEKWNTHAVCGWPGHCVGDPCRFPWDCDANLDCSLETCAARLDAPCNTSDGCSGNLICASGKCTASPGAPVCGWPGHCVGALCRTGTRFDCDLDLDCSSDTCTARLDAPCNTSNGCSGNLICASGKCAVSPGSPVCGWPGHCVGAPCRMDTWLDCDDFLWCSSDTCRAQADAPCNTSDGCDGTLVCTSSICSESAGDPVCSWAGHCVGAPCRMGTNFDCDSSLECSSDTCAARLDAPCRTNDVCSGNLVCASGKCSTSPGAPECGWPGHCVGAPCRIGTFLDCAWGLDCPSGTCAARVEPPCNTSSECSVDLVCTDGTCSEAAGALACGWPGHCVGAPCLMGTTFDCDDFLDCSSRVRLARALRRCSVPHQHLR